MSKCVETGTRIKSHFYGDKATTKLELIRFHVITNAIRITIGNFNNGGNCNIVINHLDVRNECINV